MKQDVWVAIGITILALSMFFFEREKNEIETDYGIIYFQEEQEWQAYGEAISRGFYCEVHPLKRTREKVASLHNELIEKVANYLEISPALIAFDVRFTKNLKEITKRYDEVKRGSGGVETPHGVNAFYSPRDNSVFFSVDRLTRELVLHETSHAVVDDYFGREVPASIDEIISRDVESLAASCEVENEGVIISWE